MPPVSITLHYQWMCCSLSGFWNDGDAAPPSCKCWSCITCVCESTLRSFSSFSGIYLYELLQVVTDLRLCWWRSGSRGWDRGRWRRWWRFGGRQLDPCGTNCLQSSQSWRRNHQTRTVNRWLNNLATYLKVIFYTNSRTVNVSCPVMDNLQSHGDTQPC